MHQVYFSNCHGGASTEAQVHTHSHATPILEVTQLIFHLFLSSSKSVRLDGNSDG
jgi:hypothetical protein